ncbi:MAG: hypothetical protein ACD_75C00157G0004, partial [uncultured bacterium]
MTNKLSGLLDLRTMQELTDSLYAAAGIPSALIADDGSVLTRSGWQEICRDFHCRHPEGRKNCNCTTIRSPEIPVAKATHAVSKCPFGLFHAVTPIIVDGNFFGHFFAGPFLHHQPDHDEIEYFKQQAERFGFDEQAYLNALHKVPVFAPERVASVMEFLGHFAGIITRAGLANGRRTTFSPPPIQANGQLAEKEKEHNSPQHALLQYPELTQILLDTIPAAVYYKDSEGKYLGCNTIFCDFILGLPKAEILGRKRFEVATIPAGLAAIYHQKDLELLANGISQRYEAAVRCADGQIRDFLFHKAVFRDSTGTACGIIGVMIDISERKQIERMVQESEQRLAQIIQGNSIATFVIDRDHTITHWNTACENLLETAAADMIGTKKQWMPFYAAARPVLADVVVDRMPEEHIQQLYSKCKRSSIIDGAYEAEGFFSRLGRKGKWLFFTAAPLKDAEGNIVGAIDTLQDISANKHAEEMMKTARTLAEDSNRAKSEFLAAMSHEIRTPMNAIIGMTGLMQESALTGQQQHYLKVVQTASEHLLILIDNVFDFSKIEAKKLELLEAPFNLQELVVDTVAMFEYQTEQKGLHLSCNVDPNIPAYVCGDFQRLRQILVNLIGNAQKFTKKGRIDVHVALVSATENSREAPPSQLVTLLFRVEDTGIGIPPSGQNKIFDSFTQLDGSFRRKNGGVGLGLTIAKQLVCLMGGKIQVESRPGSGSRFSFTVSLKSIPRNKFLEIRQLDAGEGAAAGRPLHILLADDLLVNQVITAAILGKWGHSIRAVFNGVEALDALRQEHFDLVLMDVQMPLMDGLDAVRHIRASTDKNIARIPVVALTAHAVKGDRERFLKAGMNAYIAKPVRSAALLQAIGKIMPNNLPPPPKVSVAASDMIDLNYMLTLMDGNGEAFLKGCGAILRDIPNLLQQLNEALRNGDDCTVSRLAHSIKSIAKCLKADEVAVAAEKMERTASRKNLEEAGR